MFLNAIMIRGGVFHLAFCIWYPYSKNLEKLVTQLFNKIGPRQ